MQKQLSWCPQLIRLYRKLFSSNHVTIQYFLVTSSGNHDPFPFRQWLFCFTPLFPLFGMSSVLVLACVKVRFHCSIHTRVKFTFENKIEAIDKRLHVNIKVEPQSTFLSMHDTLYIASILFIAYNLHAFTRKNYSTVEIHLKCGWLTV